MPNAAARIAVDDVDQLGDGMHAVANDVPGDTLGCCNQFPIDHQQTVIEALDVVLYKAFASSL